MPRRTFLRRAIGLASLIACGQLPRVATADDALFRSQAMAAWRKRIVAILARGGLPIIDIEATYVDGATNLSRMIDNMAALDIAQIAFAPANARNSQGSLALYRQYPEYFIPTANSGEFPRWWQNPEAFLAGVKSDLDTGNYFLMGEHEFRHYPSPEQVRANNTARDITIDIEGPAGQALFALSESSGIAFQLHYEIEERLLPPLEAMLARYPKARVIWCHLGMVRYPERAGPYGPAYVSRLIERFPGLHFDLAVPAPDSVYAPSGARDSTLFSGGRLADDWKALIEQHPERFLSATDYRPPVEMNYPAVIARQRQLILAALSEATRHQVAYGNAWRLITGEPWRT